jgi:hypothetical protein
MAAVFLNIGKDFDTTWQSGYLYKWSKSEFSTNLIKRYKYYVFGHYPSSCPFFKKLYEPAIPFLEIGSSSTILKKPHSSNKSTICYHFYGDQLTIQTNSAFWLQ